MPINNFRETPGSDHIPVNIVGGSTFGRYHKISSAFTQNMFMSDEWLVNFSGYKKVLTPSVVPGEGRGIFHSTRSNVLVAIIAGGVYVIDSNFVVTQVTGPDTLASEAGEISMDENLNSQVCIVDGINAYILNLNKPYTLTKQTGGPLGTNLIPNYVRFHDTFFLIGNALTNSNGAQWWAYSPGVAAGLGTLTVLGTGVLAATELIINGVDVAGTYTSPTAFVDFINTGIVPGVEATLTGAGVNLFSSSNIVLSTAGTVSSDGITFANFDTTGGAITTTFNSLSSTVITPTTQLALQTKPDYAIAIIPVPSQANNVLVFGTIVCEIQQNIGGTQNYRRSQSANVDFGCLSIATIASSDRFIAWLGVNESNSPVIMVFTGQGAEAISTDGIDYVLGRIAFPAQSTAFFYRQDGHLFYQLTFFNAVDNLTLIYDFETKKFFHLTDQFENFHPAVDVVYFNNATFFLSLRNGALYKISTDYTYIDENLQINALKPGFDPKLVYNIPRTRICDPIRKEDSGRFRSNSFVFTMAQGDDPFVTGLSLALGIQNPIITEPGFVPPLTPLMTELNNQIIVAERNTLPSAPGDIYPWLPPTQLVYRPRVDCTISKDSGTTFGPTVSKGLNPLGDRQNVITFQSMGAANDLTIKLRFWGLGSFIVGNGEVQLY